MPNDLPDMLNVAEIAELLRVHPNTVYKWVKEGTLDAVVIGKTVRFRREDIEALLSGERAG